jgi:hypothetical protein
MTEGSRVVIKQYGIQRSGTNYLEKLVKVNFSPRQVLFLTNQLQCKHHAMDLGVYGQWLADNPHMEYLNYELGKMCFTINVRDPMSWSFGFLRHLKGMKHPAGKPKDPKEHIKQIRVMNEIYANWRDETERMSDRVVVIRFEDLLLDFKVALREMATKFSLHTRDTYLHDVEREVLSGGRMSKKNYDRREYYANKQYLQEMTPNVKLAVLETVDWEVASFFGYAPEE